MTEATQEKVVETPPNALVALAKDLASASNAVEELEKKLKEAKEKERGIEKGLADEMVTQQVKAFRVEGLGGFRSQAVVYPNVTDREALTSYVKKRKKLAFLYTVSINGTKLRSFVKELLEQGKPIPAGIEPYTQVEIRRFK